MDFSLSEKDQKLFERAKEYTREHVTPRSHELDKRNDFPKDVVQKAYEEGLMNLHIPPEAGGPGLSLLSRTSRSFFLMPVRAFSICSSVISSSFDTVAASLRMCRMLRPL